MQLRSARKIGQSRPGMCILALTLAVLCALPCACAQITEAALVRGSLSMGSDEWNASDFGWFFYDIDQNAGGERLSVQPSERTVGKGDLTYTSSAWSRSFKFKPWGHYQAIAFLGKPYLAGYLSSEFSDSKLTQGDLRQVLIDDNGTHSLRSNSSLYLKDGYALALGNISSGGSAAEILLTRNLTAVDQKTVAPGETYVYKPGGLPIILAHAAGVVPHKDGASVEIDGVFQVRDRPDFNLSKGNRTGGLLEVSEISSSHLEMKNSEVVSLGRNTFIPLAEGLALRVLDDPDLIYYPEGIISEYGLYEIRGPTFGEESSVPVVLGNISGHAQARWEAENFSGFYFDGHRIGSESLAIFSTEGRTVQPIKPPQIINNTYVANGMMYSTMVQPRQFQFSHWGQYNVVGFLGELLFAGYGKNTSSDIGNSSLIDGDYLGRILLDSNESVSAKAGDVLALADGYELQVAGVDPDGIMAKLLKDGWPVDNGTAVKPGSAYLYRAGMGNVTDMPIIAVHLNNISSNGSIYMADLDGIFQVSDEVLPVEEGHDFGVLRVLASTPQFIIMGNPSSLALARGWSISIWPGMDIRVADNQTLRYYLYDQSYVVPSPRLESIDLPRYNTSNTHPANFTMRVLAGEINSVTASILDPSGSAVFIKDLARTGMGSGDAWTYAWSWNASVLKLSDDGSLIPDTGVPFVPALLYLNSSERPKLAAVLFDDRGEITSIMDNSTLYYISPSAYSLAKLNESYKEMLANQTLRENYIKIEPGKSILRFYNMAGFATGLSDINHTLTGSLEDLEPHIERTYALAGRYELQLRIENAMNALRVTELYFNVTAPESKVSLAAP